MKKILKKTGAALLGFTLALSALTGCGAKQDTSSDAKKNDADSVVYRTVDEIKESGTINIGVFSGNYGIRNLTRYP